MPTLGSRRDQANSGRNPPVESSILFPVGPEVLLEAFHPGGPWLQPQQSGKLRTMRLEHLQDVLLHFVTIGKHHDPLDDLFQRQIEKRGGRGGGGQRKSELAAVMCAHLIKAFKHSLSPVPLC